MFEIVQNLENVAERLAQLRSESEPVVVLAPLEYIKPDYIFGIIREPKPGQVNAPGTRRQPESYRFINGKREPNRRSRFSQR